MKRFLNFGALGLLLLATRAWCLGNGTSNSDFTKIGVGARPAGMGEAYAAVADDADAAYWNPAGIAMADRPQLTAMHMIYVADINIESVGLVYPTSKLDGWSLGTTYINQSFDSTANPFGIVPTQSAQGVASDLAINIGYAHNFGNFRTPDFNISNILLGFNARYLSRTLQGFQANALQGDFGAMAEPVEGLRVALVLQNIGTTATFINDADPSVANVRGGLAWHTAIGASANLLLAMDINHPVDLSNDNFNRWRENFGVELGLFSVLALRGGYRLGYDTGNLAFGAGFSWHGFGLDYAFVPYDALGDTHRLSASYAWGNPIPRPEISAPSAPRDLTGIAGDRLVSLAWASSPEKDVIGYNVYYSRASGRDYVRTTERPEGKARSLRVQLQNNQRYYFVVTAVNAAGKESDFSEEVALSPYAAINAPAVRSLTARALGSIVELNWTPEPGKNVAGYNVYYSKTSGSDYHRLNRAGLMTEAKCQLKGLKPGDTYYFVVTQVSGDGVESDYSRQASAKPAEGTVEQPLPQKEQPKKHRPSYLDQPF